MSAITNPGEFVDTTTAMALEEKAKLQKHFTRFDIYLGRFSARYGTPVNVNIPYRRPNAR